MIIDHTLWQTVSNLPTEAVSPTVGISGNSNFHLLDDKIEVLKVNWLLNVAPGESSKLTQSSSCWIYGYKFPPSLLMHSLEEKYIKNNTIFATIYL